MVRKSTKRDIIWTWCSNTPIWIMILAFWIQKGKKSAAITITRDVTLIDMSDPAQLTLGYLDGGSYFASNRVKVEQSHIKSVLGRVGFQLGRDIDAKTNIYIKADLLHEFGGGYDVKMTAANGDGLYQSADFDDTWVEYGIGAAIRTGHNNHLYFDVERTAGSDFKKDWQWNIGARWEF